jgi:hypothetical protein
MYAMTDKDIFTERGRSLEEEYFRRKDKELIEKMRKAAAAEETRVELGKRTGLADPELLAELETLGFTPETVILLPLVPIIQVAWAEGGVSDAERHLIVKLARARGISEGSAADAKLMEWLNRRPADRVFADAARLIRAMLDAPGHPGISVTADDLVKQAESIASASGGMLGIIGRVSAEERQILTTLAGQLKGRG